MYKTNIQQKGVITEIHLIDLNVITKIRVLKQEEAYKYLEGKKHTPVVGVWC